MADRIEGLTQQLCKDPGQPVPNPTLSYWQQPPHETIANKQSAQLPQDADIVIIGSGITGCSIARHLLHDNPQIRIVMLEARSITSGATGRNGGHIKATPELSYANLVSEIGKQAAEEVIRFTMSNMHELLSLKETLDPALVKKAELRAVEAINIYTNEELLAQASRTFTDFGESVPFMKDRSRFISKQDLAVDFGIHNAAGGFAAQAGAAWPYRLITELLANLVDKYPTGLSIEAHTPATEINFLGGEKADYSISTPRGKIRARTVIHATNGHAGHLLPGLRGALFPVRGQMTAQAPSAEFGIQGGQRSWSITYGRGFDYITQSGSTGEIFAGGALSLSDILTEVGNPRDDENGSAMQDHLYEILNSTFGMKATQDVKASWTGVMGFTVDHLPMVGQLPQEATLREGRGEWVSAGYNGYGMANAWLCGKYVADQILQKEKHSSVPSSYVLTGERLRRLNPSKAAAYWLSFSDLG